MSQFSLLTPIIKFLNVYQFKLNTFGVDASASVTQTNAHSNESEVKTGHSTTAAAVDVTETINSGRTDKSSATTVDSGRTDKSSSETSGKQTTESTGSKNTTSTAARQNTSSTTSTTTNSGRVDTTQTILEQTAIDRLIAQMLEGNQGLQAVTSGQRASGGYNSSATQLLTNDLLARTAGEIAVRGAKTVNITGGSSSTTSTNTVENIAAVDTIQLIGGGSTTVTNNSVTKGQNIIGGSTVTSNGTTQIGESKSTNTANMGERVTDTFATSAGRKDSAQTQSNVTVKGGMSTILCTEFLSQGKVDARLHRHSHARFFRRYSESQRAGYYYWAVPLVKYIRKHPNGIVSAVTLRVVTGAVKCIAEFPPHHKYGANLLDKVIFHVGSVICAIIAKTVARKFVFNLSMLKDGEV
jgi:hypothetical protein